MELPTWETPLWSKATKPNPHFEKALLPWLFTKMAAPVGLNGLLNCT